MSDTNLLSLTIIFIIAFLSPIFAKKIKFISIPEVIIQIIAGFLLGTSGLGLIEESVPINFLAMLGFAFLMFLSGFEVDFYSFKKDTTKNEVNSINTFKYASLIMISTISLAIVFATILFYAGFVKNILLMSLIFSTTALGVVVPVLKENQIINSPFGQTILISALFSDFSTLFLLPVIMFLVKGKMDFTIFYSLLLIVFFIISFVILKSLTKSTALKSLRKEHFNKAALKTNHLDVRMIMPVLFMFAFLSESLGIEIIIGAFMAGMLFSLVLKKEIQTETLSEKLDSIGFGFLVPIFFIMIGAKFEINSLFSKETLLLVPIFLLIAYVVKLIPGFFILRKYFGNTKALSAGFLLSSRLSLIIALSAIALKSGIITNSMYSTLVIVAITTCIVSPVVFMKLYKKARISNVD